MFPLTRVAFVLVAYFLSEAVSIPPGVPGPNTTTTIPPPPTTTTTTNITTQRPPTTTTPSPQYSKTVECKSTSSSQNEQDDGNYGDMVCYDEAIPNNGNNHQLLIRDTIINYDQESQANYHKDLANIAVARVTVLNFGRSHAFTKSIIIENHEYGARVDINIDIPSSKEVRLFVEIYGQNRDKLTNPQRMSKNLV